MVFESIHARFLPYKRYAAEFLYVLGPLTRKKLLPLVGGFVFLSLLDLVGLSLIGPFVALAANPEHLDLIPGFSGIGRSIEPQNYFQVISVIGALIVVLFIAKSISGFYVNRAIVKFSLEHQKHIKLRLFSSYLALPLENALQKNSSSLLTTVNQHAMVFTNRIMIPGLRAISELVFFTSLFVFLLLQNAIVTVSLGLLFLVLAVVYDVIVKIRIQQSGGETLNASRSTVKVIGQAVDGFKEIRVAGAEAFFLGELERFSDLYARATTYAQSLSVIPKYLIEASVISFVVVLLLLGLVVYGGPSPELISLVGIFAFAAIRSMSSVSTLLTSSNHLRFGRPALRDLVHDLEEATLSSRSAPKIASDGSSKIKRLEAMPFRDQLCAVEVSYTYPRKSVAALSGVSIRIKKGESVGLIGASGSGKTTLADVLLGLLHPQQGFVSVDGQPIVNNLRAWMNNIAYIPQSVFLLDDTISANIAMGIPHEQIDRERLSDAIKWSQLEAMIAALPKKEQTVVGERGARISGGQRQRIALARALYHGRDLLVMDEATAALDSETEHEIVESIKGLRGKVTLIVIAHRVTTLRYCTTIYRLDAGRIVQTGTYDDVIS